MKNIKVKRTDFYCQVVKHVVTIGMLAGAVSIAALIRWVVWMPEFMR